MTQSQWQEARRLLCIRLDAMGDVLMTSPALHALKAAHPDRHLTLMTSASGARIAAMIPAIDAVLRYDPPWMKATAPRPDAAADLDMIQALKAQAFDGVVIFTVYSQNPLPAAMMCYLADIPLRLAHCHENPYQLLTDWLPDPEPQQLVRHEARRQLDLVASIGCRPDSEKLQLAIPATALQAVQQRLAAAGISRQRPMIVLHSGATAPSRCYPPEKFAVAARHLVEQLDAQLIFTGSGAETAMVQAIQAAMKAPSWSFAGGLDLPELAALIQQADLLVSNNTGPAHIAAAVQTPVVDLYALTNPQHAPWQVPHALLFHDVPCRYCYKSLCPQGHHDCLGKVEPDAVVEAARMLLAGTHLAGQLPALAACPSPLAYPDELTGATTGGRLI
jgi:lipopolysaccharide heptosyltransferase II